jgi:hypothetical protein
VSIGFAPKSENIEGALTWHRESGPFGGFFIGEWNADIDDLPYLRQAPDGISTPGQILLASSPRSISAGERAQ